eukprot:EG_transcript_22862
MDIIPEQRQALLWDFRLVLFRRWHSVRHFLQSADAISPKLGRYSWLRVFKRLEPSLGLELKAEFVDRQPFVLFRCLDLDGDELLSEQDICVALSEVAPPKDVAAIRRLFLLTAAHKVLFHREAPISRDDFRKACAVHLDVRSANADAFFDALPSEEWIDVEAIHGHLQKSKWTSVGDNAAEAAIRLALQAAFQKHRPGTATREVLRGLGAELVPGMDAEELRRLRHEW